VGNNAVDGPDNTDLFDPDDMVGGLRAARRFIGWQTFFDFGDGQVKPNKLIDTNGRSYRETWCALRGPGCRP